MAETLGSDFSFERGRRLAGKGPADRPPGGAAVGGAGAAVSGAVQPDALTVAPRGGAGGVGGAETPHPPEAVWRSVEADEAARIEVGDDAGEPAHSAHGKGLFLRGPGRAIVARCAQLGRDAFRAS